MRVITATMAVVGISLTSVASAGDPSLFASTIEPSAALAPTLLTFLFVMGREIVKDVEDLPGDHACGARTLPDRLGERRALAIALGFFVLFAALVPWPYHLQIFGRPYLWTYLLGVVPLLGVAVLLMLRDASPANLWRVSWILKLDMLLGVLVFWLGRAR